MPDRFHRLLERGPRSHMVAVRENLHIVEARGLLPRQRIEFDDLLDLVAEEADAPGGVLIMRGENLQIIAPHPEGAAREGGIVALVLQRDQLPDNFPLIGDLPLLHGEGHRRIGLDRADAIEAGDGSDDDDVVPFQQRARGRVAHPVDGFVHRAFLLDVRVRSRDIGLGLVIVVIADEILDRIVRKEALELAIELRGEDLVGREDQRRALHRLDHLGHGEGLARSGDAEQNLVPLAGIGTLDQLGDRGRLIAGGRIVRDELERPPALGLVRPRRPMRNERRAGFGLVESRADGDRHRREYGDDGSAGQWG